MYQRSHVRSPRAIAKDYAFRRLAVALSPAELGGLMVEIGGALTPEDWIPSQWKWHLGTWFCVLRGGPSLGWPGSELTSGAGLDAPALARLPRVRAVLDGLFPARSPLAWLGLSPAGACIHRHIDDLPHWDEHHRVHLPLRTSPGARLAVDDRWLHLPAGTTWLFNNSRPHAALNDGPDRLHLVFDLPPTPEIDALVVAGIDEAGTPDEAATERIGRDPMRALDETARRDAGRLQRLLRQ